MFSGENLHAGPPEMAAAYLFHICQYQALLDGDKRTAAWAAILFLDIKSVPARRLPDSAELEQATMRVAAREITQQELTTYFRQIQSYDGWYRNSQCDFGVDTVPLVEILSTHARASFALRIE